MKRIALFFILLPFLSIHNAWAIDCRDLWVAGVPHEIDQATSFACTQVSSNARNEVYYSDALPLPQIQHYLEAATAALNYSALRYATLGRVPKMKLVFYHHPHEHDHASQTTFAEAKLDFYGVLESCPIMIYPAALEHTVNEMKQLIAHEVFHCFQKKNFIAQARTQEQRNAGEWWLEGMAQFFSNWVYPRADLEYSPRSPTYTPVDSLLFQSYGNVHFFQSFANQTSISDLLDFMRSMPETTATTQFSALVAIPEIETRFHQFAKKMVTGTLIDSSGAYAPRSIPMPSTDNVPAGTARWTKEILFIGQTAVRFRLQLPKKATFQIRVESPIEGLQISLKKELQSTWTRLPTDFESDCENDATYDGVLTLINAPPGIHQMVTLVVAQEAKEDCPCEVAAPPQDSCLYGTWDADIDSIRSYFERLTSNVDGMRFTSVTGAMEKTFQPDGRAFTKITKLQISQEMTRRRVTMELTTEISGDIKWRYSTQGSSTICTEEIDNTKSGKATMTLNGVKQEIPMKPSMFRSMEFGHRLSYECSDSRLVYKSAQNSDSEENDRIYQYIFNRRL